MWAVVLLACLGVVEQLMASEYKVGALTIAVPGDPPAALARAFGDGVLDPAATACLECPERADIELPESLRIERDLRGGASRLVMLERARQP